MRMCGEVMMALFAEKLHYWGIEVPFTQCAGRVLPLGFRVLLIDYSYREQSLSGPSQ